MYTSVQEVSSTLIYQTLNDIVLGDTLMGKLIILVTTVSLVSCVIILHLALHSPSVSLIIHEIIS